MKCPVCTTSDLLMTDRQGVEIDYCPKCRGVWLDRGELDKIIERSIPAATTQQPPVVPGQQYRESNHSSSHMMHGHDDHHNSYHGYGNSHKKKSLLKDFFDW